MMEVDVDHRVELVLASAGRHIFRENFFTLPYWRTVLELGWGKLSSFNLGSVKSVIPLPLPPPKPKLKRKFVASAEDKNARNKTCFLGFERGFLKLQRVIDGWVICHWWYRSEMEMLGLGCYWVYLCDGGKGSWCSRLLTNADGLGRKLETDMRSGVVLERRWTKPSIANIGIKVENARKRHSG